MFDLDSSSASKSEAGNVKGPVLRDGPFFFCLGVRIQDSGFRIQDSEFRIHVCHSREPSLYQCSRLIFGAGPLERWRECGGEGPGHCGVRILDPDLWGPGLNSGHRPQATLPSSQLIFPVFRSLLTANKKTPPFRTASEKILNTEESGLRLSLCPEFLDLRFQACIFVFAHFDIGLKLIGRFGILL